MIKTLLKSVREFKKVSILTPILVFFEVILECIIPFVIAEMVKMIEEKETVELVTVLKYGGVVVILAVLSLIFGAVAGLTAAKASCGFARNLRHDLYYAVQDFSFENIDRFSTSSLVTRLTTDVNNVQHAYMMIIRMAIRSPFMFIFAIAAAFITGGRLAWIFVVVIPILGFAVFKIATKAMPMFRRVFKKYDNLNSSVQENIKGMRVVKSFVREDYEKEKFGRASRDVCVDFTRVERLLALNNPVMQLCLNIVMVFILSIGSRTVVSTGGSALNVAHLSALLTYGFMILSSLMMLSMVFVMITMSIESARRITEVLNEKSTIVSKNGALTEVKDGSIEFTDVSFKYSKSASRYALSDIDLKIESGQTIGIIGGTGSSKSTLVQLISRLYDVTEGSVKVGGVDVRDYDVESLRNNVAVVLQKNVLFSGTIKENLRWGKKDATDEEMRHACHLACADEFIDRFPDGYDTYIEQGGANVSGGQKQRLCIARALLKKPKILILDDSTSAVDTKTDAFIRKSMREYIPETTKLIIAQRISSVQDADKIIVLDGGKIIAMGNHDYLIATNEVYRETYLSQNNKGGED
ncbi:MAG: ABC transporter ATP-binding protein [Clostridia bacterium]|nr:ABC transporter ATP-binding protein [Clostridia bacterium]